MPQLNGLRFQRGKNLTPVPSSGATGYRQRDFHFASTGRTGIGNYSSASLIATFIKSSESQYPLFRNSFKSALTFFTNPLSFANNNRPTKPVVEIFSLAAASLPARSSSNKITSALSLEASPMACFSPSPNPSRAISVVLSKAISLFTLI